MSQRPVKGPQRGPGGPMGDPTARAKNFKRSLGELMKYISSYKISVIFVIFFAAASTIFMIAGPKILGKAVTEIYEGIMGKISGTGSGIDFGAVLKILVFLGALYALSSFFSYIQGYIMANISMKVSYNLRNDIIKKINKMPLGYFDGASHGDVLSRITNDVDLLTNSLHESITQIITSSATIIGIIIMMFSISWQMTVTALLIVPFTFIFVMIIVKHSQKYFIAQQSAIGKVNGHIEEMYGGHLVVKAFNGEKKSIEKFNEFNEELYTSNWKSQFFSGLMMPAINLVTNTGYVIICILGGKLAAAGSVGLGYIPSFIQYIRQFNQTLVQLGNIGSTVQQTVAASERIFEFLSEEEEIKDNVVVRINDKDDVEDTDELVHIKGSVQFAHVKFGYTHEKTIINDFSALIKPGEQIAIVGPTGAGKTTMVKLLMRFYDVSEGAILIDGYNIKDFARSELRSMFGMVLQDTWLYNASIMDNIRYGNLNASEEEIIAAAKAARADYFIRTLPGGYDMILNEEATNISQGQKQLLTIARAILSDPKILILDEATSSVDTRTEIQIQKAMKNLMKGRTSFIIAHRLSTIKDADLILCMKDGDIVEQGNHEELMNKNGFYASLYNSQFEKS